MLLAIQTGLRVSELTGLNCADVTLGADVACEGKGRKQRAVPLTRPTESVGGSGRAAPLRPPDLPVRKPMNIRYQ